jgi:ADP-ribose pyrophosphatase
VLRSIVYSGGMAQAQRTRARASKKKTPATGRGKSTARKKTAAKKRTPKPVKVLSSIVLHDSRVFQLVSDEIVEPSGARVRRDIVRHPGSVVILALDERGSEPRVLLIRQYRYAADQELWELPAGRIDEGEEPLGAAQRELAEETGYTASEWKPALLYYASPGFVDETMSMFAARGLRKGKASPEDDECITSRLVPLAQAMQWVMNGKIHDGKAIVGVLWAAQKFHIVSGSKSGKRR